MNKLFSLLFLLLTNFVFSQKACGLSSSEVDFLKCYYGFSQYDSSIMAQDIVNDILKKTGISEANFILKTCNKIDNALAVIIEKRRYLIIDEIFLNNLNKSDKYWFYLFILSHEIGHHLYGHTFEVTKDQESRIDELEADKFAGLMIRKFGGSKNDIINTLNSLPHPQDNTGSHPVYSDRVNASLKGYNNAISTEKDILKKYNVISELEYLYNRKSKQIKDARVSFFKLNKDMTTENLNNTLKLYEIATVDYNDHNLFYELSKLYHLQGNFKRAEHFLNKAAKIKNLDEYNILSWDICQEGNNGGCNKYVEKLNNIDFFKLSQPELLKIISNFYDKESNNIIKSERALLYATNFLTKLNSLSNYEKKILTNIYSDLSTIQLKKGNHIKAYENIKKSLDLKVNYTQQDLTEVNKIDNMNLATIYSNKALIEVRLMKWNDCLETIQTLKTVNNNKYTTDALYYQARAYDGLGMYQKAIKNYTKAITLVKDGEYSYLYYYRGMSKLNLKQEKNSPCSDFAIACDLGNESSCYRKQHFCNK